MSENHIIGETDGGYYVTTIGMYRYDFWNEEALIHNQRIDNAVMAFRSFKRWLCVPRQWGNPEQFHS